MGFDELWDGFDKIKNRTEDGEKFTASILKYLMKRHEIEMKYSKSLQHLHLNECFKIELEIGTMLACWNGLRDETNYLAESRQSFCDQILQLIENINGNLREDRKNRAMLVAKGNKLVSELVKTEEAMKKARAKYVDARRKQDRAQDGVQKAKAAGSSTVKLQKTAEKEEKRADKSDNEYRISVNTLKVAQDKFYDVDMPALLREFEQHEDKRLGVTREYYNTFADKQQPLGPQWTESNERFIAKIKEINIRADLDLYVEKNRPDSDQPPLRAQYISYDGSVVQEVNGGPVSQAPTVAGASITVGAGAGATSSGTALAKKPKKDIGLLPKLPGGPGKKKKDGPGAIGSEKKPSVSATVSSSCLPTVPPPAAVAGIPPTPPPTDTPLPPNISMSIHEDDNSGSGEEDKQTESTTVQTNGPPIEVVAIYAYDATEPNELSFLEGETLYLLEKDDSGWWRGRNVKGLEGLFPSNFVEIVGEGPAGNTGTIEINADYQALYDYEAEEETELTIKEGEILHVISETDGWYYGTNTHGQSGDFPSNFVEKVH